MSKHNGDRDSENIRPEQLTAYALDQLEGEALAAVERQLGDPAHEDSRRAVAEPRRLAEAVRAVATSPEASPDRSPQLRAAILAHFDKRADEPVELPRRSSWSKRTVAWLALGGVAAVLTAVIA